MYPLLNFDEVRTAVADFSVSVQDPKAAIVPSYMSTAEGLVITLSVFYDSPIPPPDIFDSFTNIPSILGDLKTLSYSDLISGADSALTSGRR